MKDLYVVSDLHLGEGRQDGKRFAATEDFFHDEDFARFLSYLAREYSDAPDSMKLVLNGDVFDFLTITRIPSKAVAQSLDMHVSRAEMKFGLNATAAKSVFKLNVIAKGHPIFFEALSKFIRAGFSVEILRGNHDLELYFTEVQQRFLELLSFVEDGASLRQLHRQVRFHQLFYREKGRVHIEHGHQYDKANSNRYPLKPTFTRRTRVGAIEMDVELLDYPIGSVFVKYFYNRVRQFDPYAPRLVSPEQYMDFIRRYNVFDVWKVYKDHYPYFIAALSPSTEVGAGEFSRREKETHESQTQQVANETGIAEFYDKWDKLKVSPEPASKAAVVKRAMEPLVRRGMWAGVFTFVVLYLWILFFMLIQEIPWLAANAFIMSLFAASSIVGAFWVWSHFRKKIRLWRVTEHEQMRKSAAELAQIVDAKVLIFGHSHHVDNSVIDDNGTVYANSGTWTTVVNPWSRIIRDARRFTFLRVRGTDVELLRWNTEGARVDPVPMFSLKEEAEAQVTLDDIDDDLVVSREHSWLPSAAAQQETEQTDEFE
ncbi:MAG: metallophosphoesterase [Deltaproteobacteria bacterium]|nr:metallophosphoesterase [Deltaproteobacteria bacterium]MBN2673090.1 metallophosphoesterase [Deltaproteobacteria bacterium]